MTQSRPRAERRRRPPPSTPDLATPATALPITIQWISAEAVRQAIGAWAYTLGAGERRPGADAVRDAVGVACAIHESAVAADRRPWTAGVSDAERAVAEDVRDLSERSGVSVRETESALALLVAARAIMRQAGEVGATVRLSAAMLAPAPTVALVDWPHARERLAAVGASVAPALATLRELARLVGAFDGMGAAPEVRASIRDLEDATAYGRSTVSDALDALESARLLDIETRPGRTTRFTLRPAVFGDADETPRLAGPPVSSNSIAPSRQGEAHVPPVAPAAGATAATLIGSFAGTPIYAPPGTPLVVDCDASGQWTCRVGPFLVLGPVRAD